MFLRFFSRFLDLLKPEVILERHLETSDISEYFVQVGRDIDKAFKILKINYERE